MRILIAGDLCPMRYIDTYFDGEKCVDNDLLNVFNNSDYSIINLEAPIKKINSIPIDKSGPNLYASDTVISLLKYINAKCVTLANNHLRDYGDDAVINTMKLLNENYINYVGGGSNKSDASRTLLINHENETIAIINCCEQEWSIATDENPGANPLEPIDIYYALLEARKKADYVLVIVHGGIEHYQLPTLEMKKLYRFFIDAGADAVINHHQHCFSGYEVYKGRPIFYGLGNFIFPAFSKNNIGWNDGYLVELTTHLQSRKTTFRIIPYNQCKEKFGVVKMTTEEEDRFNIRISDLNAVIADDRKLIKEYNSFCAENKSFFKPVLNPYSGRILQALYRRKLLPRPFSKAQLCYMYDVINCESHRNRFLNYLIEKIGCID